MPFTKFDFVAKLRSGNVVAWLRRPHRVRTYLLLMALTLILPAMAFTGLLVVRSAELQRAQTNQRLVQVAADLADNVDRDFERMFTVLDTLALSERLAQRDFAGFQDIATAAVQRLGANVLVLDPSGQQLMNTRVAFGTPLPLTADPESASRVHAFNAPVISNLFVGSVAKRPVFDLLLPLHGPGLSGHILIMTVNAERLVSLMQGLYLPSTWVMGITDRNGVIVARSADQASFVGKALPAEMFDANKREAAAFSTVNMDGVPTLRAVARSKASGWLVSASVPTAMVEAEISHSQQALVLEGLGLLALALGLASVLARMIVKPILSLAASAAALQSDEIVPMISSRVVCVNEAADALRQAAIELKSRAALLRQSELRLNLAQRTARLAYVDVKLAEQTAAFSDTYEEIFGLRPPSDDASAALQAFLERVHPDDRERVRLARRLATSKVGSFEDEFRIVLADGEVRWISAHGETLGDASGKPARMIGTNLDITRRKQQENHIRFLLREISHRAKNLLAIVQAMAAQTARTSPTYADFQSRFSQRLQGMAASHDLLVSQNWRGVDLAELARAQLLPFADEPGGRLILAGPPVFLSPTAAQSIGLALHELATNATKYGAWSLSQGKVNITWQISRDGAQPRIQLTWQERYGPEVTKPDQRGFGHTVFERMISQALAARVTLTYAPAGLVWTLAADLSSVTQEAPEEISPPVARPERRLA